MLRWSAVVLSAFCALGAVVTRARLAGPGRLFTGDLASSCSRSQLLDFAVLRDGQVVRHIPVWQLRGSSAILFETSMYIDADGAPNAYHPENTGLDDLANAGEPGHWHALVRGESGDPVIQGPGDPFPGYYVSTTALSDRTKSAASPSRYVDASKIPYVVLPRELARQTGARLGDFAVVVNLRNTRSSFAIFADIGPAGALGEGSIALAENLGVRSNPRRGGIPGGILYLIFPGSGNGRPRSLEEINAEADKLFQSWGSPNQISSCTAN
jgi:glycosyl hydrolase group 75 (putative chitosanase)